MHSTSRKRKAIREMFGSIAPRYDMLNRLLSLGIDRRWRRKAVTDLKCGNGGLILDIATGTGDMLLAAASGTDRSVRIVGVDFCGEMVEIAAAKLAASTHRDRVGVSIGSCEAIPFRDDTFDSATIAFGIRNVEDRELGLTEILRVLRPGGRLVILEFSTPRSRLFSAVYRFYFSHVLPTVGGLISDAAAYRYLPDSVAEFPDGERFSAMMNHAGFVNTKRTELSFGIVTEYLGEKPLTLSGHTPSA